MSFKDFNINPEILRSVEEKEYNKATPIQEKAIPPLLEGRDLIGCAQTGTGKTAAFAIPILHQLSQEALDPHVYNQVKALVLAPTRELAVQIGESFQVYGKYTEVSTGVVYGGVTPKRHMKVLKREPSVLVATPGRLLDLMEQGVADLSQVKYLVLDEADRMLDLGMIKDVQKIISGLPTDRQNMLFSATMPDGVTKLIKSMLKNPVTVKDNTKPEPLKGIKQELYFVDETDKTALLLELLQSMEYESVLVFVRTKKKADKICRAINIANIRAKAIHGDKNQSERLKALDLFKRKEVKVLVATDVAARGLDISKLSLVINMNMPSVSENYVHRIGRTGRAGLGGTAISFCAHQEYKFLEDIEKLQNKKIPVVKEHPYVPVNVAIKQNRKDYR